MHPKLLDLLSPLTAEEKRLQSGHMVDLSQYTLAQKYTIDSQKMLQKNQLISMRPHTRLANFPAHQHNFIEIIYMCQGETTHIIDHQTTILLKKGQLLFLNQQAWHRIKPAGLSDIGVNFLVLPKFFEPSLLLMDQNNYIHHFLTSSETKLVTPSPSQSPTEFNYLHFQVEHIIPIQNIVENLIWNLVYTQNNQGLINQKTMGLLFMLLLDNPNLIDTPKLPRHEPPLIDKIKQEIALNYNHIHLQALALKYDLSLGYLSHFIKKETGFTFKELLQEFRLTQASQLLSSSPLSIQEIMSQVGYNNSSYFYKIFHAKYQTTPLQYRQQHQIANKDTPNSK